MRKRTGGKKPTAKKPVSRKPATRKAVSKTAPSKKVVTKKPTAAKKPTAKKPATTKTASKKVASKKPSTAKKPASTKTVSKKMVTKKSATTKTASKKVASKKPFSIKAKNQMIQKKIVKQSNDKTRTWNALKSIPGRNPSVWRKDRYGNVVRFSSYGTKGKHAWELDHIKPKSKGGTDDPKNLQALHRDENQKKSDIYPYKK